MVSRKLRKFFALCSEENKFLAFFAKQINAKNEKLKIFLNYNTSEYILLADVPGVASEIKQTIRTLKKSKFKKNPIF